METRVDNCRAGAHRCANIHISTQCIADMHHICAHALLRARRTCLHAQCQMKTNWWLQTRWARCRPGADQVETRQGVGPGCAHPLLGLHLVCTWSALGLQFGPPRQLTITTVIITIIIIVVIIIIITIIFFSSKSRIHVMRWIRTLL